MTEREHLEQELRDARQDLEDCERAEAQSRMVDSDRWLAKYWRLYDRCLQLERALDAHGRSAHAMTTKLASRATVDAYIACAIWSTTDDDGNPLDDTYDADDLAPETLVQMRSEVDDFLGYCDAQGINLDGWGDEQIGHDFWLTRNRHGAGFWDRGMGEQGDRLTEAAHTFGEQHIYAGGDGRLYVL